MEIWAATRDPAAAGHPFPGAVLGADAARRAADAAGGRCATASSSEVDPLSGEARARASRSRSGGATGIFTLHSELATLPVSLPDPARGELSSVSVAGAAREAARARGRRAARAVHAVCRSRSRCTRSSAATATPRRGDDGHARREREVDVGAGGARGASSSRREARGAGRAPAGDRDRRSRGFLGLLDTEVPGSVRDLSRSCDRHVTLFPARLPFVATKTATPWGPATLVEELSVPQRSGEKRFASVVQLLEARRASARALRLLDGRNGAARAVTLRARDVESSSTASPGARSSPRCSGSAEGGRQREDVADIGILPRAAETTLEARPRRIVALALVRRAPQGSALRQPSRAAGRPRAPGAA